MREVLNPSVVHSPSGEYSHAVRVKPFLFVSGQISLDHDGKLVGYEDIGLQTRTSFENLRRVLEAAGSNINQVIHLNIYVTDMVAFRAKARGIRREFFPREFPAVTVVEVKGLAQPEYMVEIEAVALVP